MCASYRNPSGNLSLHHNLFSTCATGIRPWVAQVSRPVHHRFPQQRHLQLERKRHSQLLRPFHQLHQ